MRMFQESSCLSTAPSSSCPANGIACPYVKLSLAVKPVEMQEMQEDDVAAVVKALRADAEVAVAHTSRGEEAAAAAERAARARRRSLVQELVIANGGVPFVLHILE